jgi:hypothetical protein
MKRPAPRRSASPRQWRRPSRALRSLRRISERPSRHLQARAARLTRPTRVHPNHGPTARRLRRRRAWGPRRASAPRRLRRASASRRLRRRGVNLPSSFAKLGSRMISATRRDIGGTLIATGTENSDHIRYMTTTMTTQIRNSKAVPPTNRWCRSAPGTAPCTPRPATRSDAARGSRADVRTTALPPGTTSTSGTTAQQPPGLMRRGPRLDSCAIAAVRSGRSVGRTPVLASRAKLGRE